MAVQDLSPLYSLVYELAFNNLRQKIPEFKERRKRISKLKILRAAINYILFLQQRLYSSEYLEYEYQEF
ncbi:unnamed protein product [Bursaphelenchus xylophilus]|uniref:(pine wood nematode) hypothetical protein n=1 Tax=Bursaphelenchus xylophilus TaxID=6326 RepID=A0A7I8WVT0_BURXY|nr:unnamed protein product [Bursaphelenchus xylophilus]CAG9117657.1 unnamed protein product [Bursaphelenchus xylophilus]